MPADITGTEIIEENRTTGGARIPVPGRAAVRQRDSGRRNQPHAAEDPGRAARSHAGTQVTVGRVRHPLPDPFFVLATQNPIEQEGTYPLPEAQQDRFMFKVFVNYPRFDEEFEIARRTTARCSRTSSRVLDGRRDSRLQRMVREVPVSDHMIRYALSLVRQTRVGEPGVPEFVPNIAWGAGPRAVQFLILGGKARALLHGRDPRDRRRHSGLAKPVLRHRMVVNFAAESDGVSADDIIDRLLQETPTKEDELTRDARFKKIFAS